MYGLIIMTDMNLLPGLFFCFCFFTLMSDHTHTHIMTFFGGVGGGADKTSFINTADE